MPNLLNVIFLFSYEFNITFKNINVMFYSKKILKSYKYSRLNF